MPSSILTAPKSHNNDNGNACSTTTNCMDKSTKQQSASFGGLLDNVSKECKKKGIWSDNLQRDLPKRWEKHGNMILLPDNCFRSTEWRNLGRDLWRIVAESFQVERVGRKRRISSDDFRSPHVELLYGKDGWVEHIDNRIRYQYDVTKCMFSIGNINEKLRLAELDCKGETIVDMFVGIGYFTLPYLVHAKAKHVYAIDWNPEAIEALKRNLSANKVADKCTVIEGDCRKVCPAFVADRVNLGLLPTAKHYWLTGAKTLKPSGGTMHIHDTITSAKFERKASLPAIALASTAKETKNGKPPLPKQVSLSRIASLNAAFSINDNTDVCSNAVSSCTTVNTDSNTAESMENTDISITIFTGSDKSTDCEDVSTKKSYTESEPAENTEISMTFYANGSSSDTDAEEEQKPKRKLSRAASIVLELESKPTKEPEVEENFLLEKWSKLDPEWKKFALDAGKKITGYLNNLHDNLNWQCKIVRVGKIKSYAPHIDHVVLDLECRPVTED